MRLDQLTIVVPAKNERGNIEAFLASVHPEFQLIIVDASTDGTDEIALQARPRNTLVLSDEGNIARARQIGAERATTPWLLFSDCDMIFDPGYFETWQSLAIPDRIGVVQGAKLSADENYAFYYRIFSAGIALLASLNIPGGSGSNMIVRKSAFNEVGGFDLSLSTNEDSYLLWRIRLAGWHVAYDRRLAVYERDHRRLDEGVVRKTLHSWARSAMLMTGCGGRWVRQSDWGYWRARGATSSTRPTS